jgi:hypothetical protein
VEQVGHNMTSKEHVCSCQLHFPYVREVAIMPMDLIMELSDQ